MKQVKCRLSRALRLIFTQLADEQAILSRSYRPGSPQDDTSAGTSLSPRRVSGRSAQPLEVSRALSGHVPHPVALLDKGRHDPRIEVLGLVAPTRPMELGRPVCGEVLATDLAVRRPFGRP